MVIVKKIVVEQHEIEVNDEALVSALRALGYDVPFDDIIKIKVTVRVPSGGDWSNTDLDIDNTTPIMVRWITEVQS